MIARVLFVLLLLITQPTFAETFTTLNGASFDARFRGMWGDAAVFQRVDGKRAAIKLLNLNAASRIRVQRLNNELVAERQKRIDQLKAEAKQADAAMTGGIVLPDPVDYVPMADDAGLEDTIKHVFNQALSGNLQVFWEALPGSYQADLDGIRAYMMAKYTADRWDRGMGISNKVARLVRDKGEFILGNAMVASSVPPEAKDSIENGLGAIAALLGSLSDPTLLSHASLSDKELDSIIAKLGPQLGTNLRGLAALAPAGTEVPSLDGMIVTMTGSITGTVEMPDQDEAIEFVSIEGKWLPTQFADGWDQSLNEMRQGIDQSAAQDDSKLIDMIEPILDSFLAANTQQEFDAVIGKTMMSMGPLMEELSKSMPPGMMGPPGFGPGGGAVLLLGFGPGGGGPPPGFGPGGTGEGRPADGGSEGGRPPGR